MLNNKKYLRVWPEGIVGGGGQKDFIRGGGRKLVGGELVVRVWGACMKVDGDVSLGYEFGVDDVYNNKKMC